MCVCVCVFHQIELPRTGRDVQRCGALDAGLLYHSLNALSNAQLVGLGGSLELLEHDLFSFSNQFFVIRAYTHTV